CSRSTSAWTRPPWPTSSTWSPSNCAAWRGSAWTSAATAPRTCGSIPCRARRRAPRSTPRSTSSHGSTAGPPWTGSCATRAAATTPRRSSSCGSAAARSDSRRAWRSRATSAARSSCRAWTPTTCRRRRPPRRLPGPRRSSRDGMAKVLFVNPIIREEDDPRHVPYGMALLAAIAIREGHLVQVYDANAWRAPDAVLAQILKADRWDVIGIGGITTAYRSIKHVVRMAKELTPQALVVAGGGFLTSMPHDILRLLPEVDLGVVGEAFVTFPEVLGRLDA